MKANIGILLFFLSMLPVSVGCAPVGSDDINQSYLRGSTGPYRGRIVDARTNLPVRGAIVVAVWEHRISQIVQTNTEFYDAVEVVTDEEGSFVVDAPQIERRAPPQTRFPDFIIFKPGYRFFKGWFADVKDMAQRQNRPLLGVVKLEPNPKTGRDAASENIPVLPQSYNIPPEKIPNFLKAVKEYRSQIGRPG
jgi:hypothetical protein